MTKRELENVIAKSILVFLVCVGVCVGVYAYVHHQKKVDDRFWRDCAHQQFSC